MKVDPSGKHRKSNLYANEMEKEKLGGRGQYFQHPSSFTNFEGRKDGGEGGRGEKSLFAVAH